MRNHRVYRWNDKFCIACLTVHDIQVHSYDDRIRIRSMDDSCDGNVNIPRDADLEMYYLPRGAINASQ